jgi:acetyl esterase/lipase
MCAVHWSVGLRNGFMTVWFCFVPSLLLGQSLPSLAVSENQRFLVNSNDEPFFYLGDTAWELFHRLDREQATRYLEKRAAQGFTVIQAVALAELDGLRTPNAYGHPPLRDDDPTKPLIVEGPNNDYWDHVDWVVAKANALGMYVGLLPSWGDKWNQKWGKGPAVFTESNAEVYGQWLATRYKDAGVIWILGGDRPIESDAHRAVIDGMAKGLRLGDGGKHLITFHPIGESTSSDPFHDRSWLAFNMQQTGHRLDPTPGLERIIADYNRAPIKPVIDGEPLYEDHPISFDPVANGFSCDAPIRQRAWWHVLAGACGHTYGCHNVWQMQDQSHEPVGWARHYWHESLDLFGAGDMQHLKQLVLARPYLTRIPDQSLISSAIEQGTNHLRAARDEAGTYAIIYAPVGKEFEVDCSKLASPSLVAWWYDPRHGTASAAAPFANEGKRTFKPPREGIGNDWVLVIDTQGMYPIVTNAIDSQAKRDPISMPLWPEGIPAGPSASFTEVVDTKTKDEGSDSKGDRLIRGVTQPTIDVYLPANNPTGAMVVIYPGGGFYVLAIDKEGHDVARWLNQHGIAAAVVKYRLPDPQHGVFVETVTIPDALQAVTLVKQHATQWQLNPDRIGVMGFSAGGYLAAYVGTHVSPDSIDATDARPNTTARAPRGMVRFAAPIYPLTDYLDLGDRSDSSLRQLLGDDARTRWPAFDPAQRATANSAAMFLVHTADDGLTSRHSLRMTEPLRSHGVDCELNLFPRGGHGYGIRDVGTTVAQWPDRFLRWLDDELAK